MVLKMHDSVPNLSADEVRGTRPSLLALGKRKHARCKPNAARPEINWAALRHWIGHRQRTLLAPLGLKARKRERVRCSSLVDWPVYSRLRDTMLTTTPKRNPASKRRRDASILDRGAQPHGTRQRARKTTVDGLGGVGPERQPRPERPPAGKSGARGRTRGPPGSSPAVSQARRPMTPAPAACARVGAQAKNPLLGHLGGRRKE